MSSLKYLGLVSLLLSCQVGTGIPGTLPEATPVNNFPSCRLLTAARIFDGQNPPLEQAAILIEHNHIKRIGKAEELASSCADRQDLGDATILPGFIESHAHISFQKVPKDKVLHNGVTTALDTGGPLLASEGGQGSLRLLSTGPILQAPEGYPINIFGGHGSFAAHHEGENHSPTAPSHNHHTIGWPVSTPTEAEHAVEALVAGGAVAIKIALEPGGEPGAPWMQPHGSQSAPTPPWQMLSTETTQAIVAKAHALGKRVLAHVGENEGMRRALAAKVDTLAHIPCGAIEPTLLEQAVAMGMTFIGTLDTMAACVDAQGLGIRANAHQLARLIAENPTSGAQILYGSEIGHNNVPWGINGEELHLMLQARTASPTATDVLQIFKAATSEAGKHLGIAGLGSLTPGAPADLIAVRGNPFEKFKLLEQPDLVISGGRTVVNKF